MYTMEDFQREYAKKNFSRLTPEERREVIQSLPPEEQQEVLDALPPERIREYLDKQTAEHTAKPRKPGRKK